MDYTKYRALKLILEADILKLEKEIEVKNKQILTANQKVDEFFGEKFFFWLNRGAANPSNLVLSVSNSARYCFSDVEKSLSYFVHDRHFAESYTKAKKELQKIPKVSRKKENNMVLDILKRFDLRDYIVCGAMTDVYSGLNRIKERFFAYPFKRATEKVSISIQAKSNLTHFNCLLRKLELLKELLSRKQILMEDIEESVDEFWDKRVYIRSDKDQILVSAKEKQWVAVRIFSLIHFDWLKELLNVAKIFSNPIEEEKAKAKAILNKYTDVKPKKMNKQEFVGTMRDFLFIQEHINKAEKILNAYTMFGLIEANTWFLETHGRFAVAISNKINEFSQIEEIGNDFKHRYSWLKKYAK